ncbi:MAG: signal recognition particle-docking protein FtsY [Ketobacteraceae bacterium]|nr:signal recognition particle-docking protein FtsY [Ketobacteraceae bacterium]
MAEAAAEKTVFERYFSGQPVTNPVLDESLEAEQRVFQRFFTAANDSAPAPVTEPAPQPATAEAAPEPHKPAPAEPGITAPAQPEVSFFTRMKKGLSRTRSSFSRGMANLLIGKKEIDDELFEDIETQLLVSDVGMDATKRIMDNLAERVSRKELFDSDALYGALQEELTAILGDSKTSFEVDETKKPFVLLVVGVNGVGKTTTIGKLAKRLQLDGKTVMLAAGDTFRAAAVEQLQVWGGRNDIPVIAQHTGADSASVIYDALQAAQSRKVDVLIADTAGRLHNKSNLMEELKKVKRVLGKLDPEAPHEVMLVLDAGTGQNALNQAQLFDEAVGVTGITLTKLDGTAKGGIVFSLAEKTRLPIKFIGVGESIDDLRPFDPQEFVQALFDEED